MFPCWSSLPSSLVFCLADIFIFLQPEGLPAQAALIDYAGLFFVAWVIFIKSKMM